MPGAIKGLGVLLPTLQVQFETKTWIVGWSISVITGISGLTGPLVVALQRRCEPGSIIVACGVMLGLSCIVASFAVSVFQLTLTYVPLAGIALGLSGVLSKQLVGLCFDQNHATAIGIARTGSSIAFLVCTPLVQILLETFGWRGTMLIMGGLFSHMIVCGALVKKQLKHSFHNYKQIQEDSASAKPPSNLPLCLYTAWESFAANLDLRLLLNIRFWMAAIIFCDSRFASDMWRIYFVSTAVSKGFSSDDATMFVAVGAVGSLIAKVVQGFIIDRGPLPFWAVLGIGLSVSTATYCTTPWLSSYTTVMISAFLIMTADGFISCLIDVLVKQLLGVDLLSSAYGWMGILTTLLSFTLGFLPGWIYDTTGSFNAAFVFLCCVQASSLVTLLIVSYKKLYSIPKV
ncbi:monocarboxylate transporter 12-like isoform X2 [Acanthaster planci]|uniref:Monocarboxylate transporter 12-like isoform X2 n=1 Tax=Acanthaster planci TaxID=133434 RepID=A0A8B7YWM4_ACAPL|nr:monocarboxylate transporter 12-like isoform X2 [Acanthaster planci]